MFNMLINLGSVITKFPNINLKDALSKGQIESKKWLINEISKIGFDLGTVFILGGWYGILPALMIESDISTKIDKIISFDLDPKCEKIADAMNRQWVIDNWKFKATTADMYELNYTGLNYAVMRADGSTCNLYDTPDIIINTSCEHLGDFNKWFKLLPPDKIIVMQTNNFFKGDGHVNCVESLKEFKEQALLSDIWYEGELNLENYTRFMLIGKK